MKINTLGNEKFPCNSNFFVVSLRCEENCNAQLEIKNIKVIKWVISVKKYSLSVISIMLIIFFFLLLCCLIQNIMTTQDKISFLNQVISLLPECIGHDVRRFIACQFAFESDFGSSAFALCNNNFCGMKVSALRITLALNQDAKGEFAWFSGITSCVHDYLLWLQFNKFSRTELNNLVSFRSHLGFSGYCPEPDYLDKINTIYFQYYG